MIKRFLSFRETAEALGTDEPGLKQALEIDLAPALPAYIYCGDLPLLARLQGYEIEARGDKDDALAESFRPKLVSKHGPPIQDTFLSDSGDSFVDAFELGDSEAEIDWSDAPQHVTGHPVTFELRGYFRVHSDDVKEGARQILMGNPAVAPSCWWSPSHVMPRNAEGQPRYWLRVCPTRLALYKEAPTLWGLLFRADDVEKIRSGSLSPPATPEPATRVKPLRSDRERNLLRVIAYLWAESEVDVRPNTAGKAVEEELINGWQLDGPSRDTVAGILQEAAAIGKGKHPKFR